MLELKENNETFLLFFHGLDSSNQTSKYTCIKREPKYCQTVDYRKDFKKIFSVYEQLIIEKMQEYPSVLLAGHSLGGWFANHFAHQFGLRALLIAPCLNPSEVLADRIPNVASIDLNFPTTNLAMTQVMIEVADECLPVAVAEKTLVNLPESWQVDYFEGGQHRIARESEIQKRLNDLCGDKLV